MEIQATKLERAVVIKVGGRMDAASAPQFQLECERWIADGATHILAELSELQYVSSMGLRSFLAVAKNLQGKSGSLLLCRLQGLPRQVFEMTGLIGLFSVFGTVDEALQSLS